MSLRNRARLQKLCSHALPETDPQKLGVLLAKIDDILSETVAELSAMLEDVEQMLKGREQLSRIHPIKRIGAPRLHKVRFYSDDRQFLEHLTQFVGARMLSRKLTRVLSWEVVSQFPQQTR